MNNIEGNTIQLTRGDTLRAKVNITKDGEDYEPQEGDTVRFAMKRSEMNAKATAYKDPAPLVLRNIPTDTLVLELTPEDTKELPFGEYDYDIQMTFADGTVDTFIVDMLTLTREVE